MQNLYNEFKLLLKGSHAEKHVHFFRMDRLDDKFEAMLKTFRKVPGWSKESSMILINTGAHESQTHKGDYHGQSACSLDGQHGQNPYLIKTRNPVNPEFTVLYFNHSKSGTNDLGVTARLALQYEEAHLGSTTECLEADAKVLKDWSDHAFRANELLHATFEGRVVWRTNPINYGFDERGDENRIKRMMSKFMKENLTASSHAMDIELLTSQRPETFVHNCTNHFFTPDSKGEFNRDLFTGKAQGLRNNFFNNGEPNLAVLQSTLNFLCM